ncbi:hypothetical protein GW17_00025997, partial [Ensete ventricosum]
SFYSRCCGLLVPDDLTAFMTHHVAAPLAMPAVLVVRRAPTAGMGTPALLLFLVIALAATSDCRGHHEAPSLWQNPLRFSADSAFKIALFADLHYGENAWTDWGPAQDDNSDRVMSAVLDMEIPGDAPLYLPRSDEMHFGRQNLDFALVCCLKNFIRWM